MIQVFKENYNKTEFYGLMGKFFAETEYKKELPYLVNSVNSIWLLNIIDNEVKAFSMYEITTNNVSFKADYYVEDISFLKELFSEKFLTLKDIEKTFKTETSKIDIKKLYKKFGFIEYRKTKNYTFLERRFDHE